MCHMPAEILILAHGGNDCYTKRKEKVPNQHYSVLETLQRGYGGHVCVDCSILGNLSISQAWAGLHFNHLTQRVLHNS